MTELNGLGLHGKVKHLIERLRAREALEEKFGAASLALNENAAAIKALKVELGEQAKLAGHGLIVLVDELAAYVPVPRTGYTDEAVDVQFTRPKGINNL